MGGRPRVRFQSGDGRALSWASQYLSVNISYVIIFLAGSPKGHVLSKILNDV